jgi:macrolide transport system ATP-binding/permease protein
MGDEPTGNLDSRTGQDVIALFRRLNQEQGLTVIIVTHDPEVAASADRVVTLRDGLIVSDVRATTPVEPAHS